MEKQGQGFSRFFQRHRQTIVSLSKIFWHQPLQHRHTSTQNRGRQSRRQRTEVSWLEEAPSLPHHRSSSYAGELEKHLLDSASTTAPGLKKWNTAGPQVHGMTSIMGYICPRTGWLFSRLLRVYLHLTHVLNAENPSCCQRGGEKGPDQKTVPQTQEEELAQVAGHLIAQEGEPEIFPSGSKHFSKHNLFSAFPSTSDATGRFSRAKWMAGEKSSIIPKTSVLHFPASGRTPRMKTAANEAWEESITSSGLDPIGWHYPGHGFHRSKINPCQGHRLHRRLLDSTKKRIDGEQ